MLRCPNCDSRVRFDKGLFRGSYCKGCGAAMVISLTYVRVLMLLSFLAAEILLWIGNIRQCFYPTLGVIFAAWFKIELARLKILKSQLNLLDQLEQTLASSG